MRKPIIAGNWKMNNTIAETKALVTELIPLVKDAKADVVICTPYTDLATAVEMTRGTNIHVGAENVHWAEKGAFTGEVSANMLVELGVEYVIIGHSERRQYFGETDQTVNARVKAALSKGLKPIICVGELLEEREAGKTEEVVVRQTTEAFKDIDKSELENIVIAYEPVWAIGTGKTATADQAEDMHAHIRAVIAEKYGKEVADNTSILYGGSCKPSNAAELFAKPDVDGGLIGGAALDAASFMGIVNAF